MNRNGGKDDADGNMDQTPKFHFPPVPFPAGSGYRTLLFLGAVWAGASFCFNLLFGQNRAEFLGMFAYKYQSNYLKIFRDIQDRAHLLLAVSGNWMATSPISVARKISKAVCMPVSNRKYSGL
jgi:hypothetical protein